MSNEFYISMLTEAERFQVESNAFARQQMRQADFNVFCDRVEAIVGHPICREATVVVRGYASRYSVERVARDCA